MTQAIKSVRQPVRRSKAARKKTVVKPSADAKVVMQTLHDEHSYLASLHSALELQINRLRPGHTPDYHILLDILNYLAEYPDIHHHPLEDQVFNRLLERHHDSTSHVHELLAQHRDMARETQSLRKELEVIVSSESKPFRNRLRLQLQDYLQFYRQHIDLEETEVFPAAKKYLAAADWQAIRAALKRYDDPLFGRLKSSRFANLIAQMNQNLEEVTSEVALAEIFSVYALIESSQAIAEGLAEMRDVVQSTAKKNSSEIRGYLSDADGMGIFFAPLWIGYNNLVNTAEAFSEMRQLASHLAKGVHEPFSSRLTQFRRLIGKRNREKQYQSLH